MIAITYLLTSKWHAVDDFGVLLLAVIDLGIVTIIVLNI